MWFSVGYVCISVYIYIYKCIDIDTHLCVYICKVQTLHSCDCNHRRTENCSSSMSGEKTKKAKQPWAVSPISTAALGTAIYGQGAAGAGTDRCRWQGCMTFLGIRSLLAAATSCQPAPSVTWCSSPPMDSWVAGISRCSCHLLFQSPGNAIPCIEGWCRNLTSAAQGDLWVFRPFAPWWWMGRPKDEKMSWIRTSGIIQI